MITPLAPILALSLMTSQPGATTQPSEQNLLARVVYAEGAGESYAGKVAIASVIYNRVKAPGFPKTLRGVIYQPNAFSCVRDNSRLWKISGQPATRSRREEQVWSDCLRAVRQAATQPSIDAIAYRAVGCKGGESYFSKLRFIEKIGLHNFYGAKP